MKKENDNQYKFISPQKIDELTAIYNDYMFITRMHEQLFDVSCIKELATDQMMDMTSKKVGFPWYAEDMTSAERKEFKDFVNNNDYQKDNRVYVVFERMKKEENNFKPPVFAVEPYTISTLNMPMPSLIERYTIIYPKNAKMKDVRFFMDGQYVAVYKNDEAGDVSVRDYIQDPKLSTDFYIMTNIAEKVLRTRYDTDEKFEKMTSNAYAEGRLSVNENIIMELLGSFAEKVQGIYRDEYGLFNSLQDIKNVKGIGDKKYEKIKDYIRL